MTEPATRVLLIEDDPGDSRLVAGMLASAGGSNFAVEHADCLSVGLAHLAAGAIDVVLLDLGLPDSDGLETFDRVHRGAPEVPIVVLGRVDDEAPAMEAARRGAHDYLVKGRMDAHALGRAVRYAVTRARAEAALSESRRALSTLMDNLPGMAYRCKNNQNWTMEFVSSGCYELTGYEPEDLINDSVVSYAQLVHPDDWRDSWEDVQAALKEKRPYQLTYRIRTAGGEEKWVWEQGVGIRAPDGEVVALEGLIIDMSERRRAEQASKLLATAVEQGAEAILITDLDGTIQYVNPSFERITGYSREDAVGKTPAILKSGKHDNAFYREMWKTLARGDVWTGHFINRRKDGTLYRQEATISPVRDASGTIVSYVSAARDATREVELEEQLRQSQKMEAIGQLAGGIAHDFNNLLTAIMGNSELLLSRLAPDDPRRADLEEIREAGVRAAGLTRQLLAFSRRQVLEPVVLNLNEVVANVSKMIQRVIGEQVELVTVLDADLGLVNADPGQVEQVVLNLAVNARDAMPEGGRLVIETANADLDEEYVGSHAPVESGSYVMLAVSDSGAGMNEETRTRIFEPFFTTKESGKGTGLGLSTVYGIVKQSNGYIWVYSEMGQGTTFKVYLPRVDSPVERVGDAGLAASGSAQLSFVGDETALLVEDDDAVRTVVRRTLEGNGYNVIETRSAGEAVLLAEEYASTIDFLITDLIMPETSGRDLAQTISALRPGIKVLYMSGYSDNAVQRHGMVSSDMEFIAKPFTQDKLLEKIRQVLATRSTDSKH
ncbi:MAG: PAS domain S-box protein [Gemmatimonadota bacterium]|nr:MAG: PAS domain S-box protein [Gemmatimonadota bacterium]